MHKFAEMLMSIHVNDFATSPSIQFIAFSKTQMLDYFFFMFIHIVAFTVKCLCVEVIVFNTSKCS